MAATPQPVPTDPNGTVRQSVRTWDPSRCWFIPVIVGAWAYALSWAPVMSGLDPWVMAPVGLLCTAAGILLLRMRYTTEEYGDLQQKIATYLGLFTGLGLTGWMIRAGQTSPVDSEMVATLVLGTSVFGVLTVLLDRQAFRAGVQIEQQRQVIRTENIKQQLFDTWEFILEKSGFRGFTVLQQEDTPAGYVIAVSPSPDRPVVFSEFQAASRKIAVTASQVLSYQGTALREGDIKIEPSEVAHIHLIHVTTTRFITKPVEYVVTPGLPSINQPRNHGIYETGERVDLSMTSAHTGVVGATGSGKSVLCNVRIGRTTECVDALQWIGATDKLVPLVYPWLKPWLDGRMPRPVIDWVAGQHPYHLLMMLADAYRIMRERNARNSNVSKMVPSPEKPAIKIMIEESADALKRTDTIRVYDGREMHASQLVYEITKAGRSAGMTIDLVSQFALMDAMGRFGSEISRNITCRIALRTMTAYDGNATLVGLDNIDTTKLRDNTMLVQDSIEEPRATVAKSQYLEGDLIHAIAIHNLRNQPTLSELDVSVCEHYAGRWDPARLDELVAAARFDGIDWPVPSSIVPVISKPSPPPAKPVDPAPVSDPQTKPPPGVNQTEIDRQFKELTDLLRSDMNTFAAGVEEIPDVNADLASLEALSARVNSPAYALLSKIMGLLSEEGAPKDFAPTRMLAIMLDRIAVDAPDEAVGQAAATLGSELASLVPNLTTTRRRVNGTPTRGYSIQRLRAAYRAVAQGNVLEPENSE